MATIYDLAVSVDEVAGNELDLEVVGNETLVQEELEFGFTSDATAGTMAQPRTVDPQVVAFGIKVGGSPVDTRILTGPISVTRSYDTRLQTWSWTAKLLTPTGAFGSPFACVGPPIGKREVDIYGIYRTSTGLHWVPLISDGIVAKSKRMASTSSGYDEYFEGVCRGGRFDRSKVDLTFPIGHGLGRGTVARRCAEAAGETRFHVEPGERMLKEFRLADEVWTEPCEDLAEAENRRLLWDKHGYLWNPRVGRIRSDEPVRFTFEPRDILAISTVEVEHNEDVITEVLGYGQEQLPDEGCGDVTTEQVIEERGIYAPERPTYIQLTNATFSSNGATPDGSERVTRKTIIRETRRCGTLILRVTDVWEWYNPECARYFYDAVSASWKPLNCYVYENSLTSTSPAYAWDEERFVLKTRTVEGYAFHKGGFQLANAYHTADTGVGYAGNTGVGSLYTVDEILWRAIKGTQTTSECGYGIPDVQCGMAQGYWSRIFGWYAPKRAIKSRNPATRPLVPWDEIDPTTGIRVVGGGDAVDVGGTSVAYGVGAEEFRLVSVGGHSYWPDLRVESGAEVSDGYVVHEEEAQALYARVPGDGFRFANRESYSTEEEELVWWTNTIIDHAGDKTANTHSTTTTRRQYDGGLISPDAFGQDPAVVNESGLQGYLEAIPKMETPPQNEAIYESEAEMDESFVGALRSQTGKLFAHLIASGLLHCHPSHKETMEFAWAENLAELQQMCQWVIDESAAAVVRLTLPANFFLEVGDVIRVVYAPLKLNHLVRVRQLTWTHSGVPPLTTAVEAVLYGW